MKSLISILFFAIATVTGCSTGSGVSDSANSCGTGLKAPVLAGTCGSVIDSQMSQGSQTLAPAIEIKVNSNIGYDGTNVDSQLLFQMTSNLFNGIDSLSGKVAHGTIIKYSILPDGHGHFVPLTVKVSVDSVTHDITYLGTADGIDNGFDGTNYHYNFFVIVLHSDNTFDYEQTFFLKTQGVADDGSDNGFHGWQWYAHSVVTGGTISGANIDAQGHSDFMEAETLSGIPYVDPISNAGVTTHRYFDFVIKQRNGVYGTALQSFVGPDLLTSLNLIADKNIATYNADCESINHSDPNHGIDGYLYTPVRSRKTYSTFTINQPAWVASWWAENP